MPIVTRVKRGPSRTYEWRRAHINKVGKEKFNRDQALRMRVYRRAKKDCSSRSDALQKILATINYPPPKALEEPSIKALEGPRLMPHQQPPSPPLPSTTQRGGYRHLPTASNNQRRVANRPTLLKHTFRMVVGGPSGSGKTTIIERLIDNSEAMISPKVGEVMWFYGVEQSVTEIRARKPNIQFYSGLPDLDDMKENLDTSVNRLVVIDDQMSSPDSAATVQKLFTMYSHHLNMSVIFVVQNAFSKSNKHMRDISLNANYIIAFKNPRDVGQMKFLGMQMFPNKGGTFLEWAFSDATRRPHGYLFIDLHQDTKDCARVRTNIFPEEQGVYYVKAGTECDETFFTEDSESEGTNDVTQSQETDS